MKLKPRITQEPIFVGNAPLNTSLSAQRKYAVGERIIVQPDAPGRKEELSAVVLGMSGEQIRVRALHDFHLKDGARMTSAGDEFEVSRNEVFRVEVP